MSLAPNKGSELTILKMTIKTTGIRKKCIFFHWFDSFLNLLTFLTPGKKKTNTKKNIKSFHQMSARCFPESCVHRWQVAWKRITDTASAVTTWSAFNVQKKQIWCTKFCVEKSQMVKKAQAAQIWWEGKNLRSSLFPKHRYTFSRFWF